MGQGRGMECTGTARDGVLHAVRTVTSSMRTEYHTWYGVQSRDDMTSTGGWSVHYIYEGRGWIDPNQQQEGSASMSGIGRRAMGQRRGTDH